MQTLQALKRKPRLVSDHKVMDGINSVRVLLPQMWFDAEKCAYGLECLRQYRSDFDEKRDVLKQNPLHDWTSHAADSFRYLAMGYKELKGEPKEPPRGKTLQHGVSLNDLWTQRPIEQRI